MKITKLYVLGEQKTIELAETSFLIFVFLLKKFLSSPPNFMIIQDILISGAVNCLLLIFFSKQGIISGIMMLYTPDLTLSGVKITHKLT
jgi:hypothetical protein